jgi:transcriptional regulator with XRE-family HTH domain
MRQLRIKRGLSLRDVAAQMDISAPYLSDLERGQRQWNEHRRAKFLEVLK